MSNERRRPFIDRATGVRAGRLALAVVGVYLVLIGGSELGTLYPELRAINGVIAGGVILAAILRPWPRPDAVAIATVVAAIGFTAAAVVSPLPRYSLEAALAGIGYAAAFLLLRRAFADGPTYVWARQLLAVVALAFIAAFTALWLSVWFSWLSATDFALLPPLTLPVPTVFMRHPHVVAFTAALLLPAVWTLPGSRLGAAVRVAATAATLFLLLASGSRTVLIAAVVATLAVYAWRWRGGRRPTRAMVIGAAVVGAAVVGAVLLVGGGGFVIQRLLTLSSLAARGEIWGATVTGWLERPLLGFGPGTFSLAFPLTGYFETNSFAPRHADNALLQLLFEAGAIGAALVLPVVVLVLRRALFAVERPEARWALLFVAVGTLTDNPTDTVGLVALVIFWASAVAPAAEIEARATSPAARRLLRPAAAVALGVAALAWGSVTAADLAYAGARRAAAQGDVSGLERQLLQAASLDPWNAFYRHQLGIHHAGAGDMQTAAAHLEAALRLSPADDVIGRSLGLVYGELGRDADADRLTADAVALRTQDITNQLTRAHLELELGSADAEAPAARVVQLNHWIVADEAWRAFLGPVPAEDVTDAAIAAATGGGARVALPDAAWLMGLGGREEDATRLGAEEGDATSQAIGLVFDCRLADAAAALDGALRTEASSSNYWLVRYVVQRLSGEDTGATERIMALFSPTMPSLLHGRGRPGGLSPLVDDLRAAHLYHRLPMARVESPWSFPNPGAGIVHWLREPASAARLAAPRSRLAECVED